jgi:hypothetical protein
MADKTVFKDSYGAAVQRTLLGTAVRQLVTDGLWAGINQESGDSGDTTAWEIEDAIYQWYAPDSLTVNDGDTVYLDLADHTGGIPDDTAYSTSSGAGKIALCKAIGGKVTANGSGNHYVIGRSLLHMQGG